jgi:hypothetical protein
MPKATIAQRDKFWRTVQGNRISSTQFHKADASGLLSDVLRTNFNEPINRVAIRRMLGLKPAEVISLKAPSEEILTRCKNIRLYNVLKSAMRSEGYGTIQDFLLDIRVRQSIFKWKGMGKWTFVEFHRLLRDEFGIDLCSYLSVRDKWFFENGMAQRLPGGLSALHSKPHSAVDEY